MEEHLAKQRRIIEKRMENCSVLEAGKYVAMRTEVRRSSIDMESLKSDIGDDKFKKYEKITKFFKLIVR